MQITWDEFFARLQLLEKRRIGEVVYGVPKGGMIAAGFLKIAKSTHDPNEATIILDDVIDSGRTRLYYRERFPDKPFRAIVDKHIEKITEWVVLPWEADHPSGPESIEQNVTRMIQYIGEDPTRPGLLETPKRVVRAWDELFEGYRIDVPSLFKLFHEEADEMIIVRDVRLVSTCEHHLLPFLGTVSVGYLPRSGVVLGLSKIARVVNAFARRLQVQERLTKEIAGSFQQHLSPLGVGVVVKARHLCMGLRGVKDGNSEMVTSCMLGKFRENPEVRSEFLRLIESE